MKKAILLAVGGILAVLLLLFATFVGLLSMVFAPLKPVKTVMQTLPSPGVALGPGFAAGKQEKRSLGGHQGGDSGHYLRRFDRRRWNRIFEHIGLYDVRQWLLGDDPL